MDKEKIAAAYGAVIDTLSPLTTAERDETLRRLIDMRWHWFTNVVRKRLGSGDYA